MPNPSLTTFPGDDLFPEGGPKGPIDALERLRFDIERDAADGELVNLIQNQSGELGGWGWITPIAGSAMSGGTELAYVGVASTANYFTSELSPVVAGQYVAAAWTNPFHANSGITRTRLVWFDSAGTVVSSGIQTAYQTAAGDYAIGATVVPAGASQVALRFDVYGNTSAGNPTSTTRSLWLQKVTMATSATAADLLQTRTNLVLNPSFETNASSWTATGATLARTTAQASVGTACGQLTVTPTVVTNFCTNPSFEASAAGWAAGSTVASVTRVVGGRVGSFALQAVTDTIAQGSSTTSYVNGPVMTGIVAGRTYYGGFSMYQEPVVPAGTFPSAFLGSSRAIIRWYDSSSAQVGGDVSLGGLAGDFQVWQEREIGVTAPAGATRAQLFIGLSWTNNYPNAPAASTRFRVDRIWFADGNVAYFDGSSSDNGSQQFAWTGTAHLSTSTLTQLVTVAAIKTTALPVVPGVTYAAAAAFRAAATARTTTTVFEWRSSTGAVLSTVTTPGGNESTSAWNRYGIPKIAPAGAATLVVTFGVTVNTFTAGEVHYIDAALVEPAATLGTYFDGATADDAVWDYAWNGTANASTSRATSVNNLVDLPAAYYVSIIAESSSLTVERQELNLSTLTGTVVSASLDPSESTLLRPGRHCRLMVNVATDITSDPEDWQEIFTGRTKKADVQYRLLAAAEEKRAIITLTVVDATTRLAQESRPDGVARIVDLPYVLEGCGVPWSVNGSGNQAPSATVVATNDQATAVDQIAVTRDSVAGYAWVDRRGVLQAWDSSAIPSTVADTLTETDYTTDLGISFATDRVVNQVSFDSYELNPASGTFETVTHGPYRDETSIRDWKDVYEKTFTVQGLTTTQIQTLATGILSANSTPARRFDYVTLALTEETIGRATLDLYDLVTVHNDRANLHDSLRIVGITHTITASKNGARWLMRLDFAGDGSAAPPQLIPQPGSGPATPVPAYVAGTVVSATTDASGLVTVTHNGGATPASIHLTGRNTSWEPVTSSYTSTTLTVRMQRRSTEATAPGGTSVDFDWIVYLRATP